MITLKDVTSDNWLQCILLTTNPSGDHTLFEGFVVSNAVSLAQSKIEPHWKTKAVYHEDTLIGFTMYGFDFKQNYYEICRLMIDFKFQGKGYGKMALLQILEEMKKELQCEEIYLSFDSENVIARRLYEGVGFQDTGQIVKGNIEERLYRLKTQNA